MSPDAAQRDDRQRRFRAAYGRHRADEGRAAGPDELRQLPYVAHGPLARQWRVRARTFDRFVERIVVPRERAAAARPLRVLDLGAGNGWLCHRLAARGHQAVAVDVRTDAVDGLGAAADLARVSKHRFARVAASFDALPFGPAGFDLVVFNAALHYALDLPQVLAEAARVLARQGRVAVLDSPFYGRRAHGEAMVAEKRAASSERFGALAADLTALPFIEYLTADTLAHASIPAGLVWRRHRVRYPLWYELRPLVGAVLRRRPSSRFDVWEGRCG